MKSQLLATHLLQHRFPPRGPICPFPGSSTITLQTRFCRNKSVGVLCIFKVFSFSEKNSGLGIKTSLADSVTNWEFNPELDQSLPASPVLTCKFPGPTIQAVRSRDPSTCPDPTPITEMSAFLLKSNPVASHFLGAPKGNGSSSMVDWGWVSSKQTAPPQLSPRSPANLSQSQHLCLDTPPAHFSLKSVWGSCQTLALCRWR